MAKRFYVCPVIGDGTWGNAYRAKLSDHMTESGAAMVAVIASNADGTPKWPFALCLCSAVNHAALGSVADVDQFPDITLDSQLSVLTTPQRNAMLNFLTKRGISTTGLNSTSTFRDVLERLGKYLDVNFNALNFDAE